MRISFNWTKGGMMGGLRMAIRNLERIRDNREVNLDARIAAAEATAKMWLVGELLAKQKEPIA